MNVLELFAGAGGGILGGLLHGWKTVCAVEIDPFCREVLLRRQLDGCLPRFPIWDDVQTFDGRPWRGCVDVVSGGFPCQDISCAGKGAGINGERSGLWGEMARVVCEVRPRFVFVENSPMLTVRGLGRVLGDLAEMGFDARWGVFGARHVGAPHRRDRIWIVTDANGKRLEGAEFQRERECERSGVGDGGCKVANTHETHADIGRSGTSTFCGQQSKSTQIQEKWWSTEPDVGRVAHGVAFAMDRLSALGNGQVPAVAALAWEVLK